MEIPKFDEEPVRPDYTHEFVVLAMISITVPNHGVQRIIAGNAAALEQFSLKAHLAYLFA